MERSLQPLIFILFYLVCVTSRVLSSNKDPLPLEWKQEKERQIHNAHKQLASDFYNHHEFPEAEVKYDNPPHKAPVCPHGHYWNRTVCTLCVACHGDQKEVSSCTSTKNTVCMSDRDFRIAVDCLRRAQRLKMRGRWLYHPCLVQYSKQVSQLRGHMFRRSADDTSKHGEPRREEDTTVRSTVSTSTPDPVLEDDLPSIAISSMYPSTRLRPTSDSTGAINERAGIKWEHTEGGGDDGQSQPVNFPVVNDARPTGPGIHTPFGFSTQKPPTHIGGTWEGGGSNGLGMVHTASKGKTNEDADHGLSPGSQDSQSSPADLTWVYSLVAAVVLIVAVTIFIASRLQAKRNTKRDIKGSSLNPSSKAAPNEENIEMSLSNGWENPLQEINETKDVSKISVMDSCAVQIIPDVALKDLKSSNSQVNLDWLAKTKELNAQNDYGSYHSEAETQTDSETVSHNSKTVFRTPWQFSGTFSAEGGILQRENSDVALVVGKDAVMCGEYVQINAAIFTDASEIRRKFNLAANEMLITPLVEYHAEGGYQFHHHVSVKLPHALADDFDASLIKFYTFSVDDCGNAVLETLPLKSKDNNNPEAYWEISNQDQCFIAKTTHFSGYFCTSCESKTKLPSVYARVFGSHIQIKSNRREIRLILYIWDRRLNIKDFIEAVMQQECDMDRQLLADEPVPLLDNASSDSSIIMRMETLGDPQDQQCWRHVTRSNASRPLFKPLQMRKLRQIVLCCQQNNPMRIEWAMENVPDTCPSSVFQCLIEMVHVPDGVTDYEEAFQEADEEYIRTFYIRSLTLSKNTIVEEEEPLSRQELVKKKMSEVMDRQEMESICQAFGINKKDIGNLSKKFNSEDALKKQLLEECSRKCGRDNFILALPHVLQQTQLFHVAQALQAHDLLSSLSTLKSSSSSVSCKEYKGSIGSGRLETTACKSLASCVGQESRSQQSCNEEEHSDAGYERTRLQDNSGLRLNIPSDSYVANGRQISPDSDYGSPLNGDEHLNNINIAVDGRPWISRNQFLPSKVCNSSIIENNMYPTSDTLTSGSEVDDDSCLANVDSEDFRCVQGRGDTENYISSSYDDNDNDDSCVANVDSQDLNDLDRVMVSKEEAEDTLTKELAVVQDEKPWKADAVYPELTEEQHVSQNGPVAMPSNRLRENSPEQTLRKEMYV